MPKILQIETIPFRLPMKGALSWGQASRMEAVEHLLVRLTTDTGHVGLAEAPPRPTIYGETAQSIETIIQRYMAPALLGVDVSDFESINRRMDVVAYNFTAKGAIDIALHQALAASRGQTLLDYLDPPERKVKVSYILGISELDRMLSEARSVYDGGVRILKVKVGRDFPADLERLEALQFEFKGSGLALYADANQGLLPDEAQTQLGQLAERGVLYAEEPLPVANIPARAALRESETLPLIADDSAFTPSDLARELHFDTFDILNIKTPRSGYTRSRQMLTMARARGKGVMIGSNASSTLGTLRAAFFAGLEGVDHPSELSFPLKLEDDIVNRPIQFVDGYVDLDDLAGIELDEARLKKFAKHNRAVGANKLF